LIIASSAGHSEIVSYLLQLEGVNVDAVNSTGQSAMHYAASKDRLQVIFFLRVCFTASFTVFCSMFTLSLTILVLSEALYVENSSVMFCFRFCVAEFCNRFCNKCL